MTTAVYAGTFDPRGESKKPVNDSQTFGQFLDDYIRLHVAKLRSDALPAILGVFRSKFGTTPLTVVASSPLDCQKWLHGLKEEREWSDSTFTRYVKHGRGMFNWAIKWKLVTENPFAEIECEGESDKRETRISPEQESRLLEACDRLNDPVPTRLTRVTVPMVDEIRALAAVGTMQKELAARFGLSRALVCQIVNGRVWQPANRKRSVGSEMQRRLVAALDLGVRAGEMLAIQVKHIDFKNWTIGLPKTITKAKRDQRVFVGTERLKQILIARRFLGDDAYVFGRENGRRVASFDKSWKKLFTLAGLPVGRTDGYVWHDLRHEYCSNLLDQGGTIEEVRAMARHADIRTTARYLSPDEDRLKELAKRGRRSSSAS